MTTTPSIPVSPLRQRMQHDIMMRGLSPRTQHQYVRNVQRFAAFLKRPPDTATPEDLRSFQIHQHECGANAGTINSTVSALRFFYTVTLRRRDLARGLVATRRPHTVREVLSVEEAARLLEAAGDQVQGRAGCGLWRGPACLGGGSPQGRRYRQPAHADPRRAGQGRTGPQRHALAAVARAAQDMVARGQAARLDVSAWLAFPPGAATPIRSRPGSCTAPSAGRSFWWSRSYVYEQIDQHCSLMYEHIPLT